MGKIKNKICILLVFFIILLLKPAKSFAASPVGIFDGINPANWTIQGWVYDPDTPTVSSNVHIYLEGPPGIGYLLGEFPTNLERPGVNAAYNITGKHGFVVSIPEYLRNQFHTFYVYGIDDVSGDGNVQLSQSPKSISNVPNANLSISGTVDGSVMTIKTSSRTAGAINSVVWRNKEFINAFDHGRELQTASSFDRHGECFNPTEAGGRDDGRADNDLPHPPSSVLNYSSSTSNSLTTIISPGYWIRPGNFCAVNSPAVNTSIVSSHLIQKDVTIGKFNIPNIIEYKASFYLPIPHSRATFEVVTGYMTNDFTSYWSYNPSTDVLLPMPHTPMGEQDLPLIFSTPDKQYAMGIYSPGLPQATWPGAGYGRFDFSGDPINGTNKWNCVYRESDLQVGTKSYVCYIAVGTLDTARMAMKQLYAALHATTSKPGDANGDNKVDGVDYVVWLNNYNKNVTGATNGDFNGSGKVDGVDYVVWVNNYGK